MKRRNAKLAQPQVRERMHIHADIEGTDLTGRSIVRVSGTYLATDANENAEYLTMDELLVTEDVSELFRSITTSFKRLKRN